MPTIFPPQQAAGLQNLSKAISDTFAVFGKTMAQAFSGVNEAAIAATRGMSDYVNKHYEPSDGSYPPDMDME